MSTTPTAATASRPFTDDNSAPFAAEEMPINLPGGPLYPSDYAALEHRWIDCDTADRAFLRRVDSATGSRVIGQRNAADYAGIVIPYFWPGDPNVHEYRLRRDHPEMVVDTTGGKKSHRKYLSPPGSANRLYFPPQTRPELLTDVRVTLVLTEGEFKALALGRLAWHGLGDAAETPRFLAVALQGVWNWRGTVGQAAHADGIPADVKGPIPDLSRINWSGRRVVIVLDADLAVNSAVQAARQKLTAELKSRGAHVVWFQFPADVTPAEKGVDDLLASRGPQVVLDLIDNAPPAKAKPTVVPLPGDWRAGLLTNRSGPKSVIANAMLALRKAPEWQGVLAFDEFNVRTILAKDAPWTKAGSAWTDRDDVLFAEWLQQEHIDVSPEVAGKAVEAVARERKVHPVRDYLNGLKWDGVPRLDGVLAAYFGVQANTPKQAAYRSAVGRCWMISAVARIMKPGEKVDTCLVLEGDQGLFKSTALQVLAGPDWFADEISDLGTKDAALQLHGKWIIELAEVTALVRSDSSAAKAFMSRSTDHFRPPYGKRASDFPRQCVFAGTTNDSAYLKDETGNRRFWPVACTAIDLDALRRDRDQLWAEAVVRYKRGERWWLDTPELNEQAAEEQADRYEGDPWQDLIEAFISTQESVSVAEVLKKMGKLFEEHWTRQDQMRVARCLKALGWDRRRVRGAGVGTREWRYWPKTPPVSQP